MNNIIELTDSLIGIDVPIDLYVFGVDNDTNIFSYFDEEKENYIEIELLKKECEVIGFATKYEVTFDCEEYVELLTGFGYRNYKSNFDDILLNYSLEKREDSFRSLIESKSGRTFINPLGEKKPQKINFNQNDNYENGEREMIERQICYRNKKISEWEAAENNLLRKVVVLKQIK